MKKIKALIICLIPIIITLFLTGCREADNVSYNLSLQADSFNVTRRITVMNMRTDKIILQMTGKISIDTNMNNNELEILVEVAKGTYQKHFIYLNEYTMYTVEDLTGADVSPYAYELEFLPQEIVGVKIRADEVAEDLSNFTQE